MATDSTSKRSSGRMVAAEKGDVFEVAKIIDERVEDKTTLYRIRWKGYTANYDTWEPLTNLGGCQRAVKDWHKKHPPSASSPPAPASRKRSTRLSSGPHSKRAKTSRSPSTPAQVQPLDLDGREDVEHWEVYHHPSSRLPGVIIQKPERKLEKPKQAFKYIPKPTDPQVLQHPNYELFQMKLDMLDGPQVTLVNEVDLDPSPPVDFEFLDELRLSENVPKWDEQFMFGCGCPETGCEDAEECDCLEETDPRKFAYNRHGRVIRSNRTSIVECNTFCNCGPDCINRVVQNGRKVRLEIFKTVGKGWGLRSPDFLKNGTFVDVYLGEVIDNAEASRRGKDGFHQGASYLFDLDKFHLVDEDSAEGSADEQNDVDDGNHEVNTRGEIYAIDGRECGGVTRFVNHSCDPNLSVYAVMTNRKDRLVYNLALFANRDVQPYEELTFLYSQGKATDDDAEPSQDGSVKWPCLCGAPNCMKWLWG